MQCADTPRLQVFTPEVAKIEGQDYRRLDVDSGRHHMAILLMVCHPRNQWLVTADPRLAKVGAQFSLEMSGQSSRPPSFDSSVRVVSRMISSDHFGS